MLQIAICDDERFYQEKIQSLLAKFFDGRGMEYTVASFFSGEEFLGQCENNVRFDIVFLDISMAEVDGIQTAMRIRSFYSDTYIVFVTAFIDYALEGYKVNAVRYLMKDTLDLAMDECMTAILHKMRLSWVTFTFLEGKKKLYTDNIVYVESRGHKTFFYYMESERVVYQIYDKLDDVEKVLDGHGFLRIHKSYLVNMKHISKISNYMAYLDTGEELSVPRLRFQTVKEAFLAYQGEVG